MGWDFINLILYLFSFFVVPYSIAFGLPLESDPLWMDLEISLDIMILIDCCANFVTDRDEDPGSHPTNSRIAKRYLMKEFKYDILSCLPDLVRTYQNCELDKGDNPWYWLKLFRFFQFSRIMLLIDRIVYTFTNKLKKHTIHNVNYVVRLIV
jgi:hypothetical protein